MTEKDTGLQNTPEYLRPITISVNTQLGDIRAYLDRERKSTTGLTETQQSLYASVPLQPYDGVTLTARDLSNAFSPYSFTYVGLDKTRSLKCF